MADGTRAYPQPASPLATPSATRAVLEAHGLHTKYALGQNFLVNDGVVRKILELADVQLGNRILEVGPGIGTLTAALLGASAQVTAIEKDPDLPAVLADTLAPWADRFTLVQADALAVPALSPLPEGVRNANKFVANLPYAVAATVVLDYFQQFEQLESATVMVQKEVADRIAAAPGTRACGAYTVKLGLYAQVAGRFAVAPGNFFPPPRVESAVIRLNRRVLLSPDEARATCEMADAAFANRRKTIANSFKAYFGENEQAALPAAAVAAFLEQVGIDPKRRGETLTQEEFIRLGKAYLALKTPLC